MTKNPVVTIFLVSFLGNSELSTFDRIAQHFIAFCPVKELCYCFARAVSGFPHWSNYTRVISVLVQHVQVIQGDFKVIKKNMKKIWPPDTPLSSSFVYISPVTRDFVLTSSLPSAF